MRKTRIFVAIGLCFLAVSAFATAQDSRRPGLWEMTTTMTWQQSPMPSGMTMPANSPFGGGAHTTQACLTQAMIDKYGIPTPQIRGNQCQIANVRKAPRNMTADWICAGTMTGKGILTASWSDPAHAISKVHFLGSMQLGQNAIPVEYTMDSTSVYKGPDCGSVKTAPIPDKDN